MAEVGMGDNPGDSLGDNPIQIDAESGLIMYLFKYPLTINLVNYTPQPQYAAVFHVGDDLETLQGQVVDSTGTPVNMGPFACTLNLSSSFNPQQVATGTFSWSDQQLGIFNYLLSSTDLANKGVLSLSIIAVATGEKMTIPTNGFVQINVQ